jgi:hypothetical protein
MNRQDAKDTKEKNQLEADCRIVKGCFKTGERSLKTTLIIQKSCDYGDLGALAVGGVRG